MEQSWRIVCAVHFSRLWRPCLLLVVVLFLATVVNHFKITTPSLLPAPLTRPIHPYTLTPNILTLPKTRTPTTTPSTANTATLPPALTLPQKPSLPPTSPSSPLLLHPPGEGGLKVEAKPPPKLKPPPNTSLHAPADWPEFFQPRDQPQFSMDYPYLHRANRTCKTPVDMVVMTLSLPKNFQEREAIRQTWGSVARTRKWPCISWNETINTSLGQVFLLGEEPKPSPNVSKRLALESEKYGDILQWEGLKDVYFNLTLKVLMGLKWVQQFCPQVSEVIKTDDDTFVHVPRLIQLLLSAPAGTRQHIWGPYFRKSPCMRAHSKYAVSRDAYPFKIFPPHVKGNLYVLPGSAVSEMVDTAPYLPYNNMEDVHVTGTLARALSLRHEAFSRLEMSTRPKAPDVCLFQDTTIPLASQRVSPRLHYQIWKSFSDPKMCRN